MEQFFAWFDQLPFPAEYLAVGGGAILMLMFSFAAIRSSDKAEQAKTKESWRDALEHAKESIPEPVSPIIAAHQKPNPVHVRILERLQRAMARDDIAETYRQKARLASNGLDVPKDAKECAAFLASLRGES